jgi:hypothetical protein
MSSNKWTILAILLFGCKSRGADATAVAPTIRAEPAPSALRTSELDAQAPLPVHNWLELDAGRASKNQPWNGEGKFRFTVTDFHFQIGTQIWRVDETGYVQDLYSNYEQVLRAEHCANTPKPEYRDACERMEKSGRTSSYQSAYYIAHYSLTPVQLGDLRQRLQAAKLATLRANYADARLHDCTTLGYALVTATSTSSSDIYTCVTAAHGHAEPPELLPVAELVRALRAPYRAAANMNKRLGEGEFNAMEHEILGWPKLE